MKINTQQAIKNLRGEVIKSNNKDFTMGEALSNVLLDTNTGEKLKFFTLAQKFYNDKEVEVDKDDLAKIKDAIRDYDSQRPNAYTNLVLGQLLSILEDLKEK